MKTKRILAIILCVLLMGSVLSGCGIADKNAGAAERLAAARDRFAPDATVLTVNGQEFTWMHYMYYLGSQLSTVLNYLTGGEIPSDFYTELGEDFTIRDYMVGYAESQMSYLASIHSEAEKRGITLSEEEEAQIDFYWEQLSLGFSPEEQQEVLKDAFMEENMVRTILRSNMEAIALLRESYGENGEKLSEEDVLAWAAENGYVHTKHILFRTSNDDGTEKENKEEIRARLEGLREELSALSGEELEKRFDELMNSESEDSAALAQFPDGYTFTAGTMVSEFETTAFALKDYELSDIVETAYGYHLLLGLPLRADDLTSSRDANTGEYLSMRIAAANDLFNREIAGWIESAELQYAPGFEDLDMNELFTCYLPINSGVLIGEGVSLVGLAVAAIVQKKREEAE